MQAKVSSIFNPLKGTGQFVVPPWRRRYSWSDSQCATPANLTFGGPGGTTLSITARTSLHAVDDRRRAVNAAG